MSEIVTTEGILSGGPRIDGTRIGVIHVADRVLDDEQTPAVVAAEYDLSLADVHRALTYTTPTTSRRWTSGDGNGESA